MVLASSALRRCVCEISNLEKWLGISALHDGEQKHYRRRTIGARVASAPSLIISYVDMYSFGAMLYQTHAGYGTALLFCLASVFALAWWLGLVLIACNGSQAGAGAAKERRILSWMYVCHSFSILFWTATFHCLDDAAKRTAADRGIISEQKVFYAIAGTAILGQLALFGPMSVRIALLYAPALLVHAVASMRAHSSEQRARDDLGNSDTDWTAGRDLYVYQWWSSLIAWGMILCASSSLSRPPLRTGTRVPHEALGNAQENGMAPGSADTGVPSCAPFEREHSYSWIRTRAVEAGLSGSSDGTAAWFGASSHASSDSGFFSDCSSVHLRYG
jgi:hypothetical protein